MAELSIKEIEKIFDEHQDSLTIYVVEQAFVNDNGLEYFKQFRGKENFISSDSVLSHHLTKITVWLTKNCPNIAELVFHLLHRKKIAAIQDIVKIMSQTFTTYSHQAVGPNVIDPIIIQEESVEIKKITKLVSVYEYSIVQPTIIILLKDNDFSRAERLLSQCPNGITAKFVKNNLQHILYKVINRGSDDLESFIDSYTTQCFNTCSHTPRGIILNEDWAENSYVDYYTPLMFKIRSKFLYDQKNDVRDDLNEIVYCFKNKSDNDILRKSFLCLALLNRVFCNDKGEQDIIDSLSLAKELDNEILLAHVYRYADLFPNISRNEKETFLKEAITIFYKNKMYDHAIYSENNELVLELYKDKLDAKKYKDLAVRATTEVHGLVGTSHIQNNAGVAYLLTGNPEKAIEYFSLGLEFAKREDRIVQRLAIQVNILLARAYALDHISTTEIIQHMRQIFDSMGIEELPYLTSNFVMNLISLALQHSPDFYRQLINDFPVVKLIKIALNSNIMCSGQLVLQMKTLAQKYVAFTLLSNINIPKEISEISGKRKRFIEQYNLNPFVFNVWI